jgi:hypothetical protein
MRFVMCLRMDCFVALIYMYSYIHVQFMSSLQVGSMVCAKQNGVLFLVHVPLTFPTQTCTDVESGVLRGGRYSHGCPTWHEKHMCTSCGDKWRL